MNSADTISRSMGNDCNQWAAAGGISARGVALLGLAVAALVSPGLRAQTSVTYPGGSSPVALAFDGVDIWVANLTGNSVTKLLASTGAIVGTYPAGSRPAGLAFDGTNIWVVDNGTNSQPSYVTKLLASTGATVGTYQVGASPWGIVFDGVNIWVQNTADDTVTKLLASTGAEVGTYVNLPAGSHPYQEAAGAGLVFDGSNIWVANGTSTVTKLSASTGAIVGTYSVGLSPVGLAFDGVNIWVTNSTDDTVTKLLASTGAKVGTYPVGGNPLGIAFDGMNIWVTNTAEASYGINGGVYTVTELLASTGATVGTFTVGSFPSSVLFDGANVWVTNQGSSTVTKIVPSQAPSISPAGVVPIDSTASTIQQGEWVSIYGSNLASGTMAWTGNFPTSLGGTSVKINGKAAYLSLVSAGQINLQAPDDSVTGSVPVVVTTAKGSATSTVTLAPFAPSFVLLDTKHVAGIILKPDGTYNVLGPTGSSLGYATVAANVGDVVEVFGVGFGPTTPAVNAGQAFSGAAPTTTPVQLRIGGTVVNPSFAGLSSAGLYQINLTIPAGLGTGDVPLTATVGGAQTQSGVVITLAGAQAIQRVLAQQLVQRSVGRHTAYFYAQLIGLFCPCNGGTDAQF
jgi:uncharacterized protein (TIGR03437 family)